MFFIRWKPISIQYKTKPYQVLYLDWLIQKDKVEKSCRQMLSLIYLVPFQMLRRRTIIHVLWQITKWNLENILLYSLNFPLFQCNLHFKESTFDLVLLTLLKEALWYFNWWNNFISLQLLIDVSFPFTSSRWFGETSIKSNRP